MDDTSISPLHNEKKPINIPVGIGGWLILIIIGLFGSILLSALDFVHYFDVWKYVDFGFGALFTVTYLNEIAVSALILILIFRRKIFFRKLFLIQTCAYALINLIIIILNGGDDAVIIFLAMTERALWTVYLFRSERVENTFIGMKSTAELMDETETPAS